MKTITITPYSNTIKRYIGNREILYLCDTDISSFTSNLPDAQSVRDTIFHFQKISNSNVFTISTLFGQSICDVEDITLIDKNQTITIVSDGNNYKVIGGSTHELCTIRWIYEGERLKGQVYSSGVWNTCLECDTNGNIYISGAAQIGSVSEDADAEKFLVVDDSGNVGYRNDIDKLKHGITENYIPYADSTNTFDDSKIENNLSGIEIHGNLQIDTISEDTDSEKVLVIDDSGVVGYTTDTGGGSGNGEIEITYSSTINIDASLAKIFHVVLGGNPTIAAPTNAEEGKSIILRLQQDGTGSRTVTWNSIFRFSEDIPEPVLSTDTDVVDQFGFLYNETEEVWDLVGQVIGFEGV